MARPTFKLPSILSKVWFSDLQLGKCFSSGSYPIDVHKYPQPVAKKKVNKPRWVPKAPSKIYKITTRRRLPPNEHAENLRLYQNHKCYLRLIYDHCQKENLKLSESGEVTEKLMEEEEREYNELMEYNRKENERLAKLREDGLELEKEKLFEEILEFKSKEAERENLFKEAALRKLEETKKLVLTFVDPDRLEAAIEHAIDNPVDYNFSIDLEGHVYRGRNTLPHLVDTKTLEVLPIIDDGYRH